MMVYAPVQQFSTRGVVASVRTEDDVSDDHVDDSSRLGSVFYCVKF